MTYPNSNIVPLTIIAAEIGTGVDELAQQLGDAVSYDRAGIRCVPTDLAREFVTAHRAAAQAERDRDIAARAEAAAKPNLLRERVLAIARAQDAYSGDPNASGLARALAADPDSRHNRSAAAFDEMMSGHSVVHRIVQEGRS